MTAPSHTYTTPGTFMVTTSVGNTDGTTVTTTQNITVTGDQATYSCIVSGLSGTTSFPVVVSASPNPPASIDAGGTFGSAPNIQLSVPATVVDHFMGEGATSLTIASQTAVEDGLTAVGGSPSGAVDPNTESASASNLPQSDTPGGRAPPIPMRPPTTR